MARVTYRNRVASVGGVMKTGALNRSYLNARLAKNKPRPVFRRWLLVVTIAIYLSLLIRRGLRQESVKEEAASLIQQPPGKQGAEAAAQLAEQEPSSIPLEERPSSPLPQQHTTSQQEPEEAAASSVTEVAEDAPPAPAEVLSPFLKEGRPDADANQEAAETSTVTAFRADASKSSKTAKSTAGSEGTTAESVWSLSPLSGGEKDEDVYDAYDEDDEEDAEEGQAPVKKTPAAVKSRRAARRRFFRMRLTGPEAPSFELMNAREAAEGGIPADASKAERIEMRQYIAKILWECVKNTRRKIQEEATRRKVTYEEVAREMGDDDVFEED